MSEKKHDRSGKCATALAYLKDGGGHSCCECGEDISEAEAWAMNRGTEYDFYRKYYTDLETGVKLPETLDLNTIHHGDAIDLIKLVPSNSVRLIVSDPPYFLGMTHNGQRGSFVDLAICKPFYKELFKEYARVLNEDGEVYWFTDWRGYAFYYPLFDAFLGARNVIVWDKMSGAGNFYAFQHEFILFHSVRADVAKKGGNVWRSPGFAAGAKATNGEKVHPTQKTLEMIGKIVRENSRPGDLVLDTFGGSGTTAVVCQEQRRNFLVFELDEDNIDIAHKRQTNGFRPTIFEEEAEAPPMISAPGKLFEDEPPAEKKKRAKTSLSEDQNAINKEREDATK